MSLDAIVGLRSSDLPQLENLLHANRLPTQDCAEQPEIFYGIYNHGALIAAGGLEPAENHVLLRSVVVHPQFRGRGLARRISEFLIGRAESEGRTAVYLLTETAANYFENLGFAAVSRENVPLSITRTRQFSALCPDSASCLVMTLPRQ